MSKSPVARDRARLNRTSRGRSPRQRLALRTERGEIHVFLVMLNAQMLLKLRYGYDHIRSPPYALPSSPSFAGSTGVSATMCPAVLSAASSVLKFSFKAETVVASLAA